MAGDSPLWRARPIGAARTRLREDRRKSPVARRPHARLHMDLSMMKRETFPIDNIYVPVKRGGDACPPPASPARRYGRSRRFHASSWPRFQVQPSMCARRRLIFGEYLAMAGCRQAQFAERAIGPNHGHGNFRGRITRGVAHERHRLRVAQRRLGQEHAGRAPGRPRRQAVALAPAGRRRPAGLAHALAQAARHRRAAAGLRHRRRARDHRLRKRQGYEWVFIDTPPNMSAVVTDAIHAATLIIIPARLTLFDLAAIKETMDLARQLRRPYAVVINGVPPRRDNTESPYVREARAALTSLNVPVWAGQITQRNTYSLALAEGEGAKEYEPHRRPPTRSPHYGPPSTSR